MKRITMLSLCCTLAWLAGCAGHFDYKRLPTAEQELYRAYSQVMTNKQSRTYLGLSSAAERAAYASEIGVAQQLEALAPEVGWHCTPGDTLTEVQLKHGKVQWWVENVREKPWSRRR